MSVLASREAARAVEYEHWMMVEALPLIAALKDQPPAVRNAVLECFLLHARLLADFYLGRGRPETDIFARTFVPDWKPGELLPTVSGLVDDLDKRLAHLTERRLGVKLDWDVDTMAAELRVAWGVFLDCVAERWPEQRPWFDVPRPANPI